jgi:hypothetical protein
MSLILGDASIDIDLLNIIRSRSRANTEWVAYQNHDMGSSQLGHLQFLQVGEGCTYTQAPNRMPDTVARLGWRYLKVGKVNLEKGVLESE